MTAYPQQLEDFKYAHLPDFLPQDICAKLTAELMSLVAQKKTRPDPQCPISQAIYGAEAFDTLLKNMQPRMEEAFDKELYPTYSYARLYYPGEELHNHVDRPSCEISATVTLGFSGGVWPIYMGSSIFKDNPFRIDMQVGDAVLYKGTDKYHWREKYVEGEWQAQVFLHYVDANGPYKECRFDGRGKLNTAD